MPLSSDAGADISLSSSTSSSLTCHPTYVGLHTSKTILLENDTDHPIKFTLKNLASAVLDQQLKERMKQELIQQEAHDRSYLSDVIEKMKSEKNVFKQRAREIRRAAKAVAKHSERKAQAEAEGREYYSSDDEDQSENDEEEEPTTATMEPLSAFSSSDFDGNATNDSIASSAAAAAAATEDELAQLDLLRAEQYLQRKFARKHRDLESSSLTRFSNSYFTIDPLEGEIWTHGCRELTIQFSPDLAGLFSTTCYIEVTGREERLPLLIKGQGLGPDAKFSYNTMDIGCVYMNAPHRYEITLQNTGNIPVNWKLVKPNPKDIASGTVQPSRFKFYPSEGTLDVSRGRNNGASASSSSSSGGINGGIALLDDEDDDEEINLLRSSTTSSSTSSSKKNTNTRDRVTIQVDFLSPQIGQFLETIQFELAGNQELLKVVYKGKVIGPTFYLEESAIDYGLISYGFLSSRSLNIHNTSAIEMTVFLHIDSDGEFNEREFNMILLGNKLDETTKEEEEKDASDLAQDGFSSTGLRHSRRKSNKLLTPKQLSSSSSSLSSNNDDDDGWDFEPKKNAPINLTTALRSNTVTIPAYHHCEIQLNLISQVNEKVYHARDSPYSLSLDIAGVGENILSLPIKARCFVSIPTIPKPLIEYQTVFLRYRYEAYVEVVNDTDLQTRFNVLPQGSGPDNGNGSSGNSNNKDILIEPDVSTYAIAPRSKYKLKVFLTAYKLGAGTSTLYLSIPGTSTTGSTDPTQQHLFPITLSYTCRGPRVTLDQKLINFGEVCALQPYTKLLTLYNDSPIPAKFKNVIHKKGSCYSVDILSGTIPPFSTQQLQVKALLNETLTMLDTLHVLIEESGDLSIQLKATGTGTTVSNTLLTLTESSGDSSSTPSNNTVDFGDQLTNTLLMRDFRLENRGRRSQILQWEYVPDISMLSNSERRMDMNASSSSAGATASGAINPLDVLSRVARMRKLGNDAELALLTPSLFTITPARITLEPNTGMFFTLSGESSRPGKVEERWICKSLIGQGKKLEIIYDITIRASFITPFLSFSTKSFSFLQTVDPKVETKECAPQVLSFTNKTALPLKFRFKVPEKFSIAQNEWELQPGQEGKTEVRFVPEVGFQSGTNSASTASLMSSTSASSSTASSKQSSKTQSDLTVIYTDHPHRDRLTLIGELCYPNLSFSSQSINFGSILNETTKRILLTITNTSSIDAEYRWFFSDRAFGKSDVTSRSVTSARSRSDTPPPLLGSSSSSSSMINRTTGRVGTPNPLLKMGTDLSKLPLNEMFDILPISGSLKPGEVEQVELTFYGHQEMKVSGYAICQVRGGPEYEIKLRGEASNISYSIDCTQIQFSSHDLSFGAPPAANMNATGTSKSFLSATATQSLLPSNSDTFYTNWKEILLTNDGRVAFDFKTFPATAATSADETPSSPVSEDALALTSSSSSSLPSSQQSAQIECLPSSGKLKAGEKQKLLVRFNNTAIHSLEGILLLQVACFEPVQISLSAVGVVPSLSVDLPIYQEWIKSESSLCAKNARDPDSSSSDSSSSSPSVVIDPNIPRYIADLGSIVKNTVQEMSFTIRNTGPVYASYTIDKKSFHSSIYSIEPTMVTRLPPGKESTFKIVCRASNSTKNTIQKKNILQEWMTCNIPVLVRNGPPFLLTITSQITIPDLVISQTKLDFGQVLLNQSREITIQLHNTKSVPAQWSFQNIIGSQVRDKDCFRLVPSEGTIEPGMRQNVLVSYTPSLLEQRKSLVRIPLKIERNARVVNIMAQGEGISNTISFSPNEIRLDTTLPYEPTRPVAFEVRNNSDRTIEFYSLDYDSLYEREENILTGDEEFDSPSHPDIMYIKPRKPGEGLSPEVLQRYKLRAKKMKRLEGEANGNGNSAANATSEVDAALVADALGQPAAGTTSLISPSASATSLTLSELSNELVRNLLVIGAPYSGKTTVAQSLLKKLDLQPYQLLSIDQVVKYFFELTEKEAEEQEARQLKEKEYQKEYANVMKKVMKKVGIANSTGAPAPTQDDLHALVVGEIGTGEFKSSLQVTPEDLSLASEVLLAINNTRARIAMEQQELALMQKIQAQNAVKAAAEAKANAGKSGNKKAAAAAAAAQAASTNLSVSTNLPESVTSPLSPNARSRTNPLSTTNKSHQNNLSSSAVGTVGSPSTYPALFTPDAELTEYIQAHTFFDLSSHTNILSKDLLTSIIYRYITLQQNGKLFKEGCVIDGTDSCFAQPEVIAECVKIAFEKMGVPQQPIVQEEVVSEVVNGDGDATTASSSSSKQPPSTRDNHLHIIALDITREESLSRLSSSRARQISLLSDESLTSLLKRFKILSTREIDKLTEVKRQEYERALDAYTKRREAEVALYQIDHLDQERMEKYWNSKKGAVEETDVAVVTADSPTAAAPTSDTIIASTSSSPSLVPISSPSSPTLLASPSISALEPAAVPSESSELTVQAPVDPLAAILAALDIPSFPPATEMPPVEVPVVEVDASADAPGPDDNGAPVSQAEASTPIEPAVQEEKTNDSSPDDAVSRKSKRVIKKSASSRSTISRGDEDAAKKSLVESPSTVDANQLQAQLAPIVPILPVRVSAMPELTVHKFMKLRRFDSGNTNDSPAGSSLPRLLYTILPWIEEVFRFEIDPRTLDPSFIPPPVTWQLVPRPGLRVRRHVKTNGFALVDPVREEEERLARIKAAAEAEGRERKEQEEATQAAKEEEEARRKGGKLTAGSSSSKRRQSMDPQVMSNLVNTTSSIDTVVPSSRPSLPTRWILAPHSSITLYASFTSSSLGSFSSSLGFELVGGVTEFELPISAACDVPSIASDPRQIFMSRRILKSLKPGQLIQKQWLQHEQVYDFGALLIGKDPDLRYTPLATPAFAPTNGLCNNSTSQPINLGNGLILTPMSSKKTHGDVWRISNSGEFPTKVDLSWLNGGGDSMMKSVETMVNSETKTGKRGGKNTATTAGKSPAIVPSVGAASIDDQPLSATSNSGAGPRLISDEKLAVKDANKPTKSGSATKGKSSSGLSAADQKALDKQRESDRLAEEARWDVLKQKRIFHVEPCSFELDVEETRDITVWAFPQACGSFADTLLATIKDNPSPILFPVRCSGMRPSVTVSMNDILFERLLLEKEEHRTIELCNTSTIPAVWSIVGMEQLASLSDILSVGPATSGILQPNATFSLTVRFAAKQETSFAVPLSIEVRDVEGFLGVLESHPLNIKCESYQNKAHVEFYNSSLLPGGGGNELTFDLLRINDTNEAIFSIVNEGLYEVRYKILVPTSKSSVSGIENQNHPFYKMFTITPSEGVVASQYKQDVIVTFHPDREFSWMRENVLKVLLYESGLTVGSTTTPTVPTKKYDIPITASASYSKFHLLPSNAINFGAVETGAQSTKTMTLHNTGAFDFEYRIYPKEEKHVYSKSQVMTRAEEKEKSEGGGGEKGKGGAGGATSTSSTSSSSKKASKAAASTEFVYRLGTTWKPSAPQIRSALSPVALIATGAKMTKEERKRAAAAASALLQVGAGSSAAVGAANATPRGAHTLTASSASPIGSGPSTGRANAPVVSGGTAGDKTATATGKAVVTSSNTAPSSKSSTSTTKKSKTASTDIYDQPTEIELGVFTVRDPCGFVKAGCSVELEMSMFVEASSGEYTEGLWIEISNTDQSTSNNQSTPSLLSYELHGETCTPGLDTINLREIFEEQTVVPIIPSQSDMNARAAAARKGVEIKDYYAVKENVFVFAPVVVRPGVNPSNTTSSSSSSSTDPARSNSPPTRDGDHLIPKKPSSPPTSGRPATKDSNGVSTSATGAPSDRVSRKRAAAANVQAVTVVPVDTPVLDLHGPAVPHGRTVRFRLSNPFKVSANVSLFLHSTQPLPASAITTTAGGRETKSAAKGGKMSTVPSTPNPSGAAVPSSSRKGVSGRDKTTSGAIDSSLNAASSCFTLSSSSLLLAPHSHSYVSVTFRPDSVQNYTTWFEAVVDNGLDLNTRSLCFEIRGEGTLPFVSVVAPKERDEETGSKPMIEFQRVFYNTEAGEPVLPPSSAAREITIRNSGVVSASVRFDLWVRGPSQSSFALIPSSAMNSCFDVMSSGRDNIRGKILTLLPNEESRLLTFFRPNNGLGVYQAELRMSVVSNASGGQIFVLKGECYTQDVTLESEEMETVPIVPGGASVIADHHQATVSIPLTSHLSFPDTALLTSVSHVLTLVNHSSTPYRFSWTAPPLQVTAAAGADSTTTTGRKQKKELSAKKKMVVAAANASPDAGTAPSTSAPTITIDGIEEKKIDAPTAVTTATAPATSTSTATKKSVSLAPSVPVEPPLGPAASALALALAAAAGSSSTSSTDSLESDFTFTPSIGHLAPHSSKNITVTFKSNVVRTYVQALAQCMVQKIKYVDPEAHNTTAATTVGKPPHTGDKASKERAAKKASAKETTTEEKSNTPAGSPSLGPAASPAAAIPSPASDEYTPLNTDWDNAQTVVRWLTESEAKERSDAIAAAKEAAAHHAAVGGSGAVSASKTSKSTKAKTPNAAAAKAAKLAAATATTAATITPSTAAQGEEQLVQVTDVAPEPVYEVVVDPTSTEVAPAVSGGKKQLGSSAAAASANSGSDTSRTSARGASSSSTTTATVAPTHTPLTHLDIRLSAVSDVSRYELSPSLPNNTIHFRPTFMYQTRSYQFTINNPANSHLKYHWAIEALAFHSEDDVEEPFSIEPSQGVMNPKSNQVFQVRFNPLTSREYVTTMKCIIPSLNTNQVPPQMTLKGTSLRPKCHFELAGQSDYLTVRRPAQFTSIPIEQGTRVVEFKSLGVKQKNVKKFYVVNPTDQNYKFVWRQEDRISSAVSASNGSESTSSASPSSSRPSTVSTATKSPFRCLTPSGTIESGRKFEMIFEYTPNQQEQSESYWRFMIPEDDEAELEEDEQTNNLEVPFLLSGSVSQPWLELDRSFLNFQTLIIGQKRTEILHLINTEETEFQWSVDKTTYNESPASNEQQILTISPTHGTILPNSKIPISITLRPSSAQSYNYNVNFIVKSKSQKLEVNIKCDAKGLQTELKYLGEADEEKEKQRRLQRAIEKESEALQLISGGGGVESSRSDALKSNRTSTSGGRSRKEKAAAAGGNTASPALTSSTSPTIIPSFSLPAVPGATPLLAAASSSVQTAPPAPAVTSGGIQDIDAFGFDLAAARVFAPVASVSAAGVLAPSSTSNALAATSSISSPSASSSSSPSSSNNNRIDFSTIPTHTRRIHHLLLRNTGEFHIDYKCVLPTTGSGSKLFKFSSTQGQILAGHTMVIDIIAGSKEEVDVKECKAVIQISGVKRYTLYLSGQTKKQKNLLPTVNQK